MLYYLVHQDNEIKQKMVRPNSEFKESCLLRAEKNKISRKLYVIKRVMTTMLYNLHPNKPLENIEGQYHPKRGFSEGTGDKTISFSHVLCVIIIIFTSANRQPSPAEDALHLLDLGFHPFLSLSISLSLALKFPMASSISAGLSLKLSPRRLTHKTPQLSSQSPFQNPSLVSYPFPATGASHFRGQRVAREVPPATLANSGNDIAVASKPAGLEKDPRELWKRYVDWLYQHKELGLYLDVSRVGFTDEFFQEMEPRLQKAFKDMEELEKGAIANPDEGRMVGHYWLRSPKLAPKPILTQQIEVTLDKICDFAEQVISGKVSFYVFRC